MEQLGELYGVGERFVHENKENGAQIMAGEFEWSLGWLVQHRFQTLTKRDFDWLFEFDGDTTLVAMCLWRLVEAG